MKPKVVRVEDLKVFDKVSKVLGKSQAKIELFKALNCKADIDFEDRDNIPAAFVWRLTPQGYNFWSSVSTGCFRLEK